MVKNFEKVIYEIRERRQGKKDNKSTRAYGLKFLESLRLKLEHHICYIKMQQTENQTRKI